MPPKRDLTTAHCKVCDVTAFTTYRLPDLNMTKHIQSDSHIKKVQLEREQYYILNIPRHGTGTDRSTYFRDHNCFYCWDEKELEHDDSPKYTCSNCNLSQCKSCNDIMMKKFGTHYSLTNKPVICYSCSV